MFTVNLFWYYLQNNIVQRIFKIIRPRFTSNKSNFYLHQQRSVAVKYANNGSAAGAPPRTPLGELTTLPQDPLVGWGGGHPYPYLGAFGASILAPAALVFQPEPYHFLKRSGARAIVSNFRVKCLPSSIL